MAFFLYILALHGVPAVFEHRGYPRQVLLPLLENLLDRTSGRLRPDHLDDVYREVGGEANVLGRFFSSCISIPITFMLLGRSNSHDGALGRGNMPHGIDYELVFAEIPLVGSQRRQACRP